MFWGEWEVVFDFWLERGFKKTQKSNNTFMNSPLQRGSEKSNTPFMNRPLQRRKKILKLKIKFIISWFTQKIKFLTESDNFCLNFLVLGDLISQNACFSLNKTVWISESVQFSYVRRWMHQLDVKTQISNFSLVSTQAHSFEMCLMKTSFRPCCKLATLSSAHN